MSARFVQQSHSFLANGSCPRFLAFFALVAIIAIVGCGGRSDVPVDDAAENIRKLALGYVQFAATNRDVGPPNRESLTKFLVQQNGFSREEAEACFISPRDNQPYVVKWGQRPLGSGPIGPKPPKPSIIIFESGGADGTRYVADGQLAIKEMSAEQFAQAVPDDKTSGN